jgi:galactose mutarotase-like enzyme
VLGAKKWIIRRILYRALGVALTKAKRIKRRKTKRPYFGATPRFVRNQKQRTYHYMAIQEFIISNASLSVKIKRTGAQLCSVIDQNKTEFMWQGGEIWPRHAPNLFPIVGSLLDHEYMYNGETISLRHHGFARDLEFDLLHQSKHSACFVLQESEDTLPSYPFKFTLLITFRLRKNRLKQIFRVLNTDDKPIPVSFGGHPAFNAGPIDEFQIELNAQEDPPHLLQGPYISQQTIAVQHHKTIQLNRTIFDKDALVFQDVKSSKAILKHQKSDYRVEVDYTDFAHLGIWAKPGADFVCIEPWQGLADLVGHNKKIEDKKGIVWVQPGEEVEKSFSMTFSS